MLLFPIVIVLFGQTRYIFPKVPDLIYSSNKTQSIKVRSAVACHHKRPEHTPLYVHNITLCTVSLSSFSKHKHIKSYIYFVIAITNFKFSTYLLCRCIISIFVTFRLYKMVVYSFIKKQRPFANLTFFLKIGI
jgi:hypothetical protein